MQSRDLAERIASRRAPAIIDVRTIFEFRDGHIAGAIHAPLWRILLGKAELPPDKQAEMVVLCELGPRAWMARVLLGCLGYRNLSLLTGHMAGWRRSGLPVKRLKAEG